MKYLVHFLVAFVFGMIAMGFLGFLSIGISAACALMGCTSTEMLAATAFCSLGSAIYVAFQ